jgi:predicted HicB family RNase H-like nuclease
MYLDYKGYAGSIEYSPEDNLLFGKVLGINGLISYEGETGKHLEGNL